MKTKTMIPKAPQVPNETRVNELRRLYYDYSGSNKPSVAPTSDDVPMQETLIEETPIGLTPTPEPACEKKSKGKQTKTKQSTNTTGLVWQIRCFQDETVSRAYARVYTIYHGQAVEMLIYAPSTQPEDPAICFPGGMPLQLSDRFVAQLPELIQEARFVLAGEQSSFFR